MEHVQLPTAGARRRRARRRGRARDALARAAIVDATRATEHESNAYACVECVVAGRRRCGRGGAEKGENGYAASIASRCDASRVLCVSLACDGAVAVRGAVCACVTFMCVRARASGVGAVRRSSSGGPRDARATQRMTGRPTRARKARRLSASFMSASSFSRTHARMHGCMDARVHGTIAVRTTRGCGVHTCDGFASDVRTRATE